MQPYLLQPCPTHGNGPGNPGTAVPPQGPVYHVWPVAPGILRSDSPEFSAVVYTGPSLEAACQRIYEIINRRRIPAALVSSWGNGTVFMELHQLPRSGRKVQP